MLAQTDDVFEPRFRSCDRALDHVRVVRWTIIGALNALQRIGDALDVVISATAMSAPSTARCGHLLSVHHGADGISRLSAVR
jgi:hypothetical protein